MVIFYADDDDDDRELFADALEEVDPAIQLILARNGFEVIQLLESQKELPDYIFLDINMPLMSGKECLMRLKRVDRLRSVPIIMYTTTSNKEEFKNLVLLGAADCVVKGISFKAIKDSLRSILSA